jgi:hypothetical protein
MTIKYTRYIKGAGIVALAVGGAAVIEGDRGRERDVDWLGASGVVEHVGAEAADVDVAVGSLCLVIETLAHVRIREVT